MCGLKVAAIPCKFTNLDQEHDAGRQSAAGPPLGVWQAYSRQARGFPAYRSWNGFKLSDNRDVAFNVEGGVSVGRTADIHHQYIGLDPPRAHAQH